MLGAPSSSLRVPTRPSSTARTMVGVVRGGRRSGLPTRAATHTRTPPRFISGFVEGGQIALTWLALPRAPAVSARAQQQQQQQQRSQRGGGGGFSCPVTLGSHDRERRREAVARSPRRGETERRGRGGGDESCGGNSSRSHPSPSLLPRPPCCASSRAPLPASQAQALPAGLGAL